MDRSRAERALRWALIELGTAGLSDQLGPDCVVALPAHATRSDRAVVAGPVVLMARRPSTGTAKPSSFTSLRAAAGLGGVVLVSCPAGVGAALGSNLALHASCLGVRAIVTDGPVRDASRLGGTGIPVLACGTSPLRPAGAAMEPMPELRLFNRTWVPGDWALLDADGLLQLPGDAVGRLASQLTAGATRELVSLLAGG
jgi:regulator of RNase E activity RraA